MTTDTDNKGKVIWLYNLNFLKSIDTTNNSFGERIYKWLEQKVTSGNPTFSRYNFNEFLELALKENMTEHDKSETPEDEVPTNKDIDNKRPTSLYIKDLEIRNFRKFLHKDFTFMLKPYQLGTDSTVRTDEMPQSLFLIGENGVGKSSIYDAIEFVMTGQISEGNYRKKDFGQDAKQAILKLITTDQTFTNEKEIKNYYRGNSMLAIFCSENDIFQIGQKLNEGDNTELFAGMMGYNDIIEIMEVLTSLANENATEKTSLSYEKEKTDTKIKKLKDEGKEALKELIKQYSYYHIKKANLELVSIHSLYKPLPIALTTKRRSKLIKQIENLKKLHEKFKESYLNSSPQNIATEAQYNELELAFKELDILLDAPSTTPKGKVADPTKTSFDINTAHNILQKINDTILECMSNVPLIQAAKNYLNKDSELKLEEKKKIEQIGVENKRSNINSLNNYIALIKEKIHETVRKEYEPYKGFITSIMEKFKLPQETFSLSIDFRENNLEIKVCNKNENNILSPSEFYNSFRYKLFCLLLKIACGLAYMKKREIRIPVIMDDVFYGSDFYSRTHVKQFFEILIEQIKELQEKGKNTKNIVQFICFTHDEVILNAIMDVMSAQNKDYINPIFGRIIDAEYVAKKSTDINESGIYIQFNHYGNNKKGTTGNDDNRIQQ